MRFWDSSAVVPLIVPQSTTGMARAWLREDPGVALWTFTPVELTSTVWRMVREEILDEPSAAAAEARAVELMQAAVSVIDVESVKTTARRLLRLHPLRTADALQLAAGVRWAEGRPEGRIFHTLDRRLAAAARREGFSVP